MKGELSAQSEEFDRLVRWGGRRQRLARALRAGEHLLVLVALVSYIGVGLAMLDERWAGLFPVVAGVSGGAMLIGVAVALLWPVDRRSVLRLLEACGQLKDGIVAAGELDRGESDFWGRQVLLRVSESISGIEWNRAWPLRVRGLYALALPVCAVLFALLFALHGQYLEAADNAARRLGLDPEELSAVEALAEEWEEPPEEFSGEEWSELREAVAEFREMLSGEAVESRDALLELSRVEERLARLAHEVAETDLARAAEAAAEAFEALDGFGQVAAELRRGDFEAAARAAAENRREMDERKDGLDELAKNREKAASRSEDAARRLEQAGKQEMARAAREMGGALRKGDQAKFASGLEAMEKGMQAMSRESARGRALRNMLGQVAQAKEGLRPGAGRTGGRPSPTEKGMAGEEAGADEHDDPFGKPTELVGERQKMNLGGTLGEGLSAVTTLQADEGGGVNSSEAVQMEFRRYERLSRQAVEDESIPWAHRESIRKYFELIRPREDSPSQ